MNLTSAIPAARSTAEAVIGRTDALFGGEGVVFNATLAIDSDARVPRYAQLLEAGRTSRVFAKVVRVHNASSAVRAVCLQCADVYGPGRDQDLLRRRGAAAPRHPAGLVNGDAVFVAVTVSRGIRTCAVWPPR